MRETAKRLVVLSGMLSLMVASAVPALAQEVAAEGTQYEAEPVAQEEVSATFELVVEGEAPEGATFFGYLNPGEPFPVALIDPDGDGVYVGTYEHVGMGDSIGAGIVQGAGSVDGAVVGASPGEPSRVIRDFGAVTFDGDTTLLAGVSFADGDEPAPVEPAADSVEPTTPVAEEPADPAPVEEAPAPVFVDVDGEDVAEEANEKADEVADPAEPSDGVRVLPSTGGAALVVIGAGALLTGAGLLVRRVFR